MSHQNPKPPSASRRLKFEGPKFEFRVWEEMTRKPVTASERRKRTEATNLEPSKQDEEMTRKPVTASERRKRTEATNLEPSKQDEEVSCIPQKKKLRLKSKAKEITPPERFPEQDEEMICQPVIGAAAEKERRMQSKEKKTLNEEACTEQQQEVIIRKRVTASKRQRRMKSKENEPTNKEPCAEHEKEVTCASVGEAVQKQYRRLKKGMKETTAREASAAGMQMRVETTPREPYEDDEQIPLISLQRKSKRKKKKDKPMTTEPSLEPYTSIQSPIVEEVDNDVHNIVVEEEVVEDAREEQGLEEGPIEEEVVEEEGLEEEVVDQECQGRRHKRHRNRRGQAGVDANQPTIGPEDPRLLISFKDHVAAHILRGRERGVLKVYCHSSTLKKWTITNERLQQRINQSGLLPLCKATYPYCNKVLLSAFVERWHPETNSFHLDFGEMGITLDDVHQLIGIPVTGSAIRTPEKDNLTLLQTCLGVTEEEAKEALIHEGVTFDWLRENFSYVSDDDLDERVDCCARAYLLYVLGSTLFVDKTGVRVRVSYLGVLEDLQNVSSYAFGAAGLAYLYRQLGQASNGDAKQLSGYTTLLEAWIQEHFPTLRNGIDPNYTDDLPRARRWLSRREVTTDSTLRYRQLLDNLQPNQVMFNPYKHERDVLLDIAFYTGCIHCLSVVEPYMPDRVLRQLGLVQSVPGPPIAPERGGKGGDEWTYGFWENWGNHLLPDDKGVFVRPGVPWECTPDYLPWFRKVSHYRVGPNRSEGEGTGRATERIAKAVALLDGALDVTGTSMHHL
ncbi:hypothetical protein Vadar_030228 [Vaccinium darrowii]|uniref:Uncharacterized protein n=1 Tax=Vaccinium darrowii TaxID=229202 RepID=A0ACB7X587_9ERIC|nr:hypothetical protein Vadar_030228 [Vaccinium darrowii]